MRVDLYFLFFKEVKEKKREKKTPKKTKNTTTTKKEKKKGVGGGGKLLIEKTDNTNYQGKGIDQYLFLFFGLPGGDSHSWVWQRSIQQSLLPPSNIPAVQKKGGPQSVELVWFIRIAERDHAADLLKTGRLGKKGNRM